LKRKAIYVWGNVPVGKITIVFDALKPVEVPPAESPIEQGRADCKTVLAA